MKRNIRWGRLCGLWFLLVLLYILVGSRPIPPEQEAQMIRETQQLMGIAVMPAMVRIVYRRLFSDD
jgi:hypothetical protein